jgi:hypothetical protein
VTGKTPRRQVQVVAGAENRSNVGLKEESNPHVAFNA